MKITITDKLKKRRAETLGFAIDVGLISRLKLHGDVDIDKETGVDYLVDGGFADLVEDGIVDANAPEFNEEVDNATTD